MRPLVERAKAAAEAAVIRARWLATVVLVIVMMGGVALLVGDLFWGEGVGFEVGYYTLTLALGYLFGFGMAAEMAAERKAVLAREANKAASERLH